jgi:hypothetical protein
MTLWLAAGSGTWLPDACTQYGHFAMEKTVPLLIGTNLMQFSCNISCTRMSVIAGCALKQENCIGMAGGIVKLFKRIAAT